MWIQYILLLLCHLLASLLPILSVCQNYNMLGHEMVSDPCFSIAQTTMLCTFTCTQPITIELKSSCARNSGTYGEEQLYSNFFLILVPDGGEWSDFLFCNHFSVTENTPGTH